MNEKALEGLHCVPLSDIFIVFVIAVAVRAMVSYLLSLKAVVRNQFLTTALRLDYTRYCCYFGPNDSSDLLV